MMLISAETSLTFTRPSPFTSPRSESTAMMPKIMLNIAHIHFAIAVNITFQQVIAGQNLNLTHEVAVRPCGTQTATYYMTTNGFTDDAFHVNVSISVL